MDVVEFHVFQQARDLRWVVRVDDAPYGDYLDKEQAMLDALEAARDALQCGREARVWLREQAKSLRLL